MGRRTARALGVLIVASLLGVMSVHGAVRPQSQSKTNDGAPVAGQQKAAPQAPSSTSSADTAKPSSHSTTASQAKAPSESKGKPESAPAKASQSNAFPMAQSEAAAQAARQKSEPQRTGSSPAQPLPTSSTGPYSSSSTGLSPNALGEGAPPLGRKRSGGMDTFTRDHTLDGRITDDLNVADFYMKNGDYRGALWRYQDALHYDPENDTARYGVAEAMCKQKRAGDAMAHFKAYLKHHPEGKYTKKAKAMLADPERCGRSR